MNKKSDKQYRNFAIWTIIVISLARVAIALITKEGGDPAWHLNVARFVGENFKLPLFEFLGREIFSKPPLFHILGGIFYNLFSIFGENFSEIGIKLISPLAGTGVLIFTYLITKEFTNERTAFFSVLFMAFLPISTYLSVTGHTEMLAAFFFVGTVYFLIKNKIYISGIFLGLSLLSKEFAIMLIPLIAFYYFTKRKDKKEKALKKFLIVLVIGIAIAAPWYIRNWILLGNPVWPFFMSLFNSKYIYPFGLKPELTPAMRHEQFSSGYPLQIFYLESFGVPAGRIDNLNLLNLPSIFLWIWFASTIIFLLPIIWSFRNKIKSKSFLYVWVLLYIFILVVTCLMNGATTPRYFIYALPAIAILWGVGVEKMMSKYEKIVLIIILLISFGFLCGEVIKAKTGNNIWNEYEKDFNWIIDNTPKDSVIMAGGQAMSYRLHRQAIYLPEKEMMSPSFIPEWNEFDYIFINQKFKPDVRVRLDEELVEKIRNNDEFEIAYSNKDTETEVYKKA